MANGLEMVYNAIGGAGGELSGFLKAEELRRLQEEADRKAQAERDALLTESQQSMSDLDRQLAEYSQKAQGLGIALPEPGSIDEQIFRATSGIGQTPVPGRSFGQTMAPRIAGEGTQLPTSKTEWAPSSAESAVSADMIRASRDILSGRPAVDPTAYRKRLELLNGLALKAASRPSTSSMAAQFNKNAESGSDFMTREGSIANDARARQGSLAGMLMGDRAQAARDKQHTQYVEGQQNARSAAQIASQERIQKEKNEIDKGREQRLEDKELRLLIGTLNQYGKTKEANKIQMLRDVRDVENGDLSVDRFLDVYPTASVEEQGWGPMKKKVVKGLDIKAAQEALARGDAIIAQAREELARRAGSATPLPENPAINPVAQPQNLPNLNDPRQPRVF